MIKLNAIHFENEGKTIVYDYEYKELHAKYFNKKNTFYATYDVAVSTLPLSIATIPFLANMLPISWFLGADIYIDEIDQQFEQAMQLFKEEMQKANPETDLYRSTLHYAKSVPNSYPASQTAMLFSGGVDAYSTYFKHADENPDLITILGADVEITDTDQWTRVVNLNKNEPQLEHNKKCYIESNLRTFYTHHLDLLAGLSWWGKIQHGLALNGVVAPLAYLRQYKTIYIASSYTADIVISWGSTPELDNAIRFANTSVVHDGYELKRQEKITRIISTTKQSGKAVNLRVCYSTLNTAVNCSRCEKCHRTMMAIIVAGGDPNLYGFKADTTLYETVMHTYKEGFATEGVQYFWWEILQKSKESDDFFVFGDKELETQKMRALQQLLEANMANGLKKKSRLYKIKFRIQNTFPKMFKMYLKVRQRGL